LPLAFRDERFELDPYCLHHASGEPRQARDKWLFAARRKRFHRQRGARCCQVKTAEPETRPLRPEGISASLPSGDEGRSARALKPEVRIEQAAIGRADRPRVLP